MKRISNIFIMRILGCMKLEVLEILLLLRKIPFPLAIMLKTIMSAIALWMFIKSILHLPIKKRMKMVFCTCVTFLLIACNYLYLNILTTNSDIESLMLSPETTLMLSSGFFSLFFSLCFLFITTNVMEIHFDVLNKYTSPTSIWIPTHAIPENVRKNILNDEHSRERIRTSYLLYIVGKHWYILRLSAELNLLMYPGIMYRYTTNRVMFLCYIFFFRSSFMLVPVYLELVYFLTCMRSVFFGHCYPRKETNRRLKLTSYYKYSVLASICKDLKTFTLVYEADCEQSMDSSQFFEDDEASECSVGIDHNDIIKGFENYCDSESTYPNSETTYPNSTTTSSELATNVGKRLSKHCTNETQFARRRNISFSSSGLTNLSVIPMDCKSSVSSADAI